MTAEDFMIGDFVHSRLHNVDTTIIAIEGRDYNAVWLESKECWERHYMNEIEPIPLTEKILQANGFEYHNGETGMCNVVVSPYYVCDGSPRIYCDGNPFAVWFEDECNIRYVHELQHVLRLCGIEKKILI